MASEYSVIFEPESEYAIQEWGDYIAHRSGLPVVGQRYIDGITKKPRIPPVTIPTPAP